MEFELFTLDTSGYMISGADRLIKRVKNTHPDIDIIRECGKNMVEIRTLPQDDIPDIMIAILDTFEKVLHCAEKEGIVLYSYGTYPGTFMPELHNEAGYKIKEQIFGKQKFAIAGRCIGLHCHYSLPKGVFNFNEKIINHLINSKHKQSMVDMYNLFIAMDPALTTFSQCSPFYQGKFLGKDSRVIVYRGGKVFNYPHGLYASHQDWGMLQPYKTTGTDLLQIIKKRNINWKGILKKLNINMEVFLKHGSLLDTAWNPVKINAHGTLEQRGLDANHPRIVIMIATLVEFITRKIQEDFVHVLPSDIGMTHPFRLEGNVLYIPPHTHVRFELQPKAAYEGLENKEVYEYCKSLFNLAKICVPKNRLCLLKPLEVMIKERKSVSDHLLDDVKKFGFNPEKLTNEQAATLSLHWSKDLFKEIIMTKRIIKDIKK